jgi:hypothetical protein
MKHVVFKLTLIVTSLLFAAGSAMGGISIGPYVSVKSTKSVKPGKKKSEETETIKQRNEAGIKANVSFFRLMKFQLGLGQSKLTTTSKTSAVKDEYDEIDYEKDMNMKTDNPENEIKITETQNVGQASLIIDPSFWIFILRAKAGVTARQRIVETEQEGAEKQTLTEGPTYKPHSGFGAGVRLGRSMYFIAEYNFYHYKFPEIEPFERELTVNFGVSL